MKALRNLRVLAAAAYLLALGGAAPDRAAPDRAAPGRAEPFVPVMRMDFPDPFVLRHGAEFLAYATNTDRGRVNVPMASSKDLANWTPVRDAAGRLRDAMPTLAPWAERGHTWAPEVLAAGNGFVLYFTARAEGTSLQCVGAAVAADPRGPFTSAATAPLVCQRDLGGTIDASPYRDADGALYLYYKNDGNAVGKPTDIWAQRLSPDGLAPTGAAVALVRNDKPWERHVIEAPTMTRGGGTLQLFYSASDFGWQDNERLSSYAMGYADCRGPMGPCVDANDNPLLASRMGAAGCISGPGHQAIFDVGGRWFISYHAWAATAGCRKADQERYMYVSPLRWNAGKPEVRMSLRPTRAK